MAMLDINIYQSNQMGGYAQIEHDDRWRAANNVSDCLESVASHQSEFSVDVSVITTSVFAPIEDLDEGFHTSPHYSQPDPACGDDAKYYDGLYNWWGEWVNCGDNSTASDANLLITNGSSGPGGRASTVSNYGVVRLGKGCADYSPSETDDLYNAQGYQSYGILAAIHEIGHNIIDYISNDGTGDNCEDHSSAHHRLGNAKQVSTGPAAYSATPMSGHNSYFECAKYKNGDENYCGNAVNQDWSDLDYYDFRFSDCATNHL